MLLRPLALLALAVPVLADEPPEQLAEEIAELREQLGGEEGMVSDRADFAEALRRVAGNEGRAAVADDYAQATWNGQSPSAPGPRRPDRSVPYDGRPGPTPTQPSFPPRHAGWGQMLQNQDRLPHPGPRPPRPTKVLLRETAFELDRLAHELEMAELVQEADSLRGTAKKLRKSAREEGGPAESKTRRPRQRRSERGADPDPGPKAKSPGLPRGRRYRNMPRLNPHENWMDRMEKRGAEGRFSPPPGVHGGPTEPPKPENE